MNIAELRRLEAEATPGVARYGVRTNGSIWISIGDLISGPHRQFDFDGPEAEAALYVAMRNALPELLMALEEARERNAIMENALTNISMMHDGNPPITLADMPEIDYARRVISTMRLHARDALPPLEASMSVEELVKELREQERSLQYNAIEYGCVDSGIAANVASQAADKLEELAAENERLSECNTYQIEEKLKLRAALAQGAKR